MSVGLDAKVNSTSLNAIWYYDDLLPLASDNTWRINDDNKISLRISSGSLSQRSFGITFERSGDIPISVNNTRYSLLGQLTQDRTGAWLN